MQETYSGIWREIASAIRLHLTADTFQRWFALMELVQAEAREKSDFELQIAE